jgi:hypothetical protein
MLMAAKRMGGKSISRAKKSHDFREVTAAKRKKTRWRRHEANEIPPPR